MANGKSSQKNVISVSNIENINLSVVIPYFKFAYFDKLLDSLVEQTNKNFNVYIGNDNSPQSPLNIITKYTNQINIQYKHFYWQYEHAVIKKWPFKLSIFLNLYQLRKTFFDSGNLRSIIIVFLRKLEFLLKVLITKV